MSYAAITQKHVNEKRRLFAEEVLSAHNICRKRHDAQPLRLHDLLTKQSQECAQQLLHAEKIETTPYPIAGENVFIIGTNDLHYSPRGEVPVNAWYQQHEQMDLKKESVNRNLLNFSQVVWKASQLLGVGIARSEKRIVIVCHYMPPGNICGEYWRNVMPLVPEKAKRSYADVASSKL